MCPHLRCSRFKGNTTCGEKSSPPPPPVVVRVEKKEKKEENLEETFLNAKIGHTEGQKPDCHEDGGGGKCCIPGGETHLEKLQYTI